MGDVDDRMVEQSIGDRLEGLADDLDRLTGQAFALGKVELAQTLYGVGLHVGAARGYLAEAQQAERG